MDADLVVLRWMMKIIKSVCGLQECVHNLSRSCGSPTKNQHAKLSIVYRCWLLRVVSIFFFVHCCQSHSPSHLPVHISHSSTPLIVNNPPNIYASSSSNKVHMYG